MIGKTGLCLVAIAFGIGVFIYEYPKLKKANLKRERYVFSGLLGTGIIFSMTHFMMTRMPSPLDLIVYLFHPIVKAIYEILS